MLRFPLDSLQQRATRLSGDFTLVKPDRHHFGAGPYPTTIMMHGCGDKDGPQLDYARAAAGLGTASIIVDSYSSRRIGKAQANGLVCAGLRLWGRERAGDVLAALHWARSQDWVQPDALSLAGWSHGGWSVMDALALGRDVARHAKLNDLDEGCLSGVTSVFLVYPWCGAGAQTMTRGWVKPVRAFMLLAEKDVLAGVRNPLRALSMAQKSGAVVDSVVYAGSTHSFDEKTTINPTFKYDPIAAARAIAFYGKWISTPPDPL
jgi:dienelactone hydrolase